MTEQQRQEVGEAIVLIESICGNLIRDEIKKIEEKIKIRS